MSHDTSHEIAIIGAGTTGAAIAYHLTQRGQHPLVLDRGGPAAGPSGASAAMLRQHYLDRKIVALARYGAAFLADMEARTGFSSGFTGCGYVVVATEEQEPRVREAHAAMRAEGAHAELLSVDQLRELEPRLHTDDLAIGCFEPEMGYCEPLFVASGLVAAAERDGATLRFGTTVRSLERDGAGWRLTLDGADAITVDTCIVAAGAWSNELLAPHGGDVPLELRRGQIGRWRPPHAFGEPGPIISDHVHDIWIRPDGPDGHYLVGGRGGRPEDDLHEPEAGPRGADADRLEDFARELTHRLPGTAGGVWRGSWASFYDFTDDGNPIADRVPGNEHLIAAFGGSAHAFKLAPALGLGVAELVCDGDVSTFDWSPLRYGRFA